LLEDLCDGGDILELTGRYPDREIVSLVIGHGEATTVHTEHDDHRTKGQSLVAIYEGVVAC